MPHDGEEFGAMRNQKKALRLTARGRLLRNRTWKMETEGEVDMAFEKVRRCLPIRERRSIAWIKGMAKSHLNRDYSESKLLKAMGVTPVDKFVLLTVCRDLSLLIEYSVRGSDGLIYERNECRESTLISLPLPQDIRAGCRAIRKSREKSDYADIWLGFDGSKIREISLMEIDWC